MVSIIEWSGPVSYANALKKLSAIDARLGGAFGIKAVETTVDLGLNGSVAAMISPELAATFSANLQTKMWVYQQVDPVTGLPLDENNPVYNPAFLTSSNVPISVTWFNGLPMGTHLLPYDPTVLMGMEGMVGITMQGMENFQAPIVTHLHGGHTAALYDGYATFTITPDNSTTYVYDNSQEGTLIWYHDHSMGLTRLNVYAGLAAGYVVEDVNRQRLADMGILGSTLGTLDTPMVIQDKAFQIDGSLFYPAYAEDPLPGTPDTVFDVVGQTYYDAYGMDATSSVPEFYGNTILVNGTVWPYLTVGQGETELQLLNGSDSRFYTFQLNNPDVKVTLLGVDGGMLEKPIVIMDGDGIQEAGEQLVMSPADRVQLLVDFSNVADGDSVELLNFGAAYEPFKGFNADGTLAIATPAIRTDANGNIIDSDPVGHIMEFRVDATAPTIDSRITADTILNPTYYAIAEADATVTRKLGVFEYADDFGRIMPLVGIAEATTDQFGTVVAPGGLGFMMPTTEIVELTDGNKPVTEVWEFYNVTADAHPIHLHQTFFQVLGRYKLTEAGTDGGDVNGDGVILEGEALYNNDFGESLALYPEDSGWQDTVWLAPGEGLKVIATFDRPGDYVWHCHIVSHEDHDMMRPLKVLGLTGDFSGMITEDSANAATGLIEIGRLDPMMQGFIAGQFMGDMGLGTLTLSNNLQVVDGMMWTDMMPAGGMDMSGMAMDAMMTDGMMLDQSGTKIIGANNGEWSYIANESAQALAEGEVVQDMVMIHELDGTMHEIMIDVVGINDAPIIASDVSLAGTGNVARVITTAELLANASDIDNGATLSVVGLSVSSGTLVDNGNGSWTYTPAINATGDVTFSYKVSDGMAAVDASASLALTGGVAMSVVNGTSAANTVNAAGSSAVDAGAGSDTVNGSSQADRITGGTGTDTIRGGSGDDVLLATLNDGNDSYDGGAGTDVYDLSATSASALVTLLSGTASSSQIGKDTIKNVENVVGSSGADIITGDNYANVLTGGAGNDTLSGLAANDTLIGGAGDDRLDGGVGSDDMRGGTGNDIYVVDSVNDTISEVSGDGFDSVEASVTYSIAAVAGVDAITLTGKGAINATGNDLDNMLVGNTAANILSGGAGNDILAGGLGNDTLNGGGGSDTASYSAATAGVTVNLSTGKATGAMGSDTLSRVENVVGGSAADTLTGDSGSNLLDGGTGNDTLNGGAGDDLLIGGVGNDTLIGGAGIDTAHYGAATTAVTVSLATGKATGGAGSDTLSGIENIIGGSAADVLTGDDAANGLDGGAGNDTLNGGLGNDVLFGRAGADNFLFKSTLGADNVDTIADFAVGTDKIQLSKSIFTAFGSTGTLGAGAFAFGNQALEADDRVIYDHYTGALYYDADGVGGGAAIQFATLATDLSLTNASFLIIA